MRPSDPADEGRDFHGWKLVTVDGDTVTVADSNVADSFWNTTVSGLENTTDAEGNVVVYNEDVILVADFGTAQFKINYYDQNGAIVHMLYAENGQTIKPNTSDDAAYQTYTPIQNEEGSYLVFEYWTQNPYGDRSAAGEITVSQNIDLYPVVSEAHHIYFDGNSSAIGGVSVSYVGSILVRPNSQPAAGTDYTPAKIIPTAKGYTFTTVPSRYSMPPAILLTQAGTS